MKLFDYLSKNVTLTDVDGAVWAGRVTTFTPWSDSEFAEDEIGILTDQGLVGFRASEIASIKQN